MVYANNSQLAVGERVLWYEVEAVVGADAFAVTYLARDTQTPSADNYSSVVAVRELLPKELIERGPSAELRANSEAHAEDFIKARQQFIEEGNALASLRHPAVVKVHFQRRANATAYMVMEWVDGISLRDALAQWQALPEVALLDRIGALLDGLTIVHESGIIHGGIAPDNVWLRHDGSAVL